MNDIRESSRSKKRRREENEDQERKEIQQLTFEFLSKADDPKTIKMKEIRTFLEAKLSYPKGTFKTEKYSKYLEQFACDFFEPQISQNPPQRMAIPIPQASSSSSSFTHSSSSSPRPAQTPPSSSASENIKAKIGKFSVTENKTILSELKKFANEKGIDMSDIHPNHRDGRKTKDFSELFDRLRTLIPNRSRNSIYVHVMRLIESKENLDKFTEADKQKLKELVAIHGRNFSKISRLLHKGRDGCKHVYDDLDKKNRGEFTAKEDDQIIEAVVQVTKQSREKLPSKKISWKAVAERLKNYRHPDDYCRRWPIILSKQEGKENNLHKDQKLLKLLNYLYKRDLNDESEISWNEVDVQLQMTGSDMMFRRAIKKHFQFDFGSLIFPEKVERLIEIYQGKSNDQESVDDLHSEELSEHSVTNDVSEEDSIFNCDDLDQYTSDNLKLTEQEEDVDDSKAENSFRSNEEIKGKQPTLAGEEQEEDLDEFDFFSSAKDGQMKRKKSKSHKREKEKRRKDSEKQ